MILNIIPINDLHDHIEESTCDCNVTVQVVNNNMLFIHNSFDKREVDEKNGIINPEKGWISIEK